jgi:hypothetical protein
MEGEYMTSLFSMIRKVYVFEIGCMILVDFSKMFVRKRSVGTILYEFIFSLVRISVHLHTVVEDAFEI